jgi:hypothetical protein
VRIVLVGSRQANGEGHSAPIADQVALASAFGPVGRIWPGLVAAVHSADGTTVHHRPPPIDLIISSSQSSYAKCTRSQMPAFCQSRNRRQHVIPRSAPEFLRQHLPRNATTKDEDNAGKTRTVRHAWPSTFRSWWSTWQERFDEIPQRIWKQRGGHTRPRYRPSAS